MTYAYHWRKAMVISVCVHLFLIIGVGHFMASLPKTLPKLEEVILEMDLVSNPAERLDSKEDARQTPPIPNILKPAMAERPPVAAVQTETKVSELEPVVSTSELSMTATESLDAPPVSNQSASSSNVNTTSHSGNAPAGGSGIAKPSILSKTDPIYPSAARQAGLEGTVILKIEILANGRPGEISVSRSTGYAALDEAAITAVEKWRFVPAKDRSSGKTIACTTTLPVSFRLHG